MDEPCYKSMMLQLLIHERTRPCVSSPQSPASLHGALPQLIELTTTISPEYKLVPVIMEM